MTTPYKPGHGEEPPLIGMLGEHKHMLLDGVPHAKAIGMQLEEVSRAEATVKIPYNEKLIGNPDSGVLHGGVITTLLDNTSGIAVFCALTELTSTATLDLRIDYMRAAHPGRDIYAHAHCYKMTRSIAFVRGWAYEDDMDDPIATSVGAFMLGSDAGRKANHNRG